MQIPLSPAASHDTGLWTDAQQTMAQRGEQLAIGPAVSASATTTTKDAHDHDHDHDPRPASLSFAERAAQLDRSPTPLLVRGDGRLLRDVTRPPPGDPRPMQQQQQQQSLRRQTSASLLSGWGSGGSGGGSRKTEDRDLVRRRSRYFEEAFSVPRRRRQQQQQQQQQQQRDDHGDDHGEDYHHDHSGGDDEPARARAVRAAAPVLAELRTNVVVADEAAVLAALAAQVAARYRRPLARVAVALQHSACLCVGGSLAPAYELAVHALPGELQPATNRRNTALLQRHLAAVLGVPPARGLLRFVPVPAANLAYGGRTAAGHMEAGEEDGDGDHGEDGLYADDAATAAGSPPEHKSHRKLSVKSLSSFRSATTARTPRTPPRSRSSSSATAAAGAPDDPPPLLPAIPERVLKESLHGRHELDGQEARPAAVAEPSLSAPSVPSSGPSSPATLTPPNTVDHQSVSGRRRARRTKSFVATLFGRAGGGNNNNGADSRSSSP